MSDKAIVTAEPGQPTMRIERTFEAPRDKVFKAMTTRELIERWWIGRDYTTKVDVFEPKTGGSWRYVQNDGNGNEFAFRGVFHTVRHDDSGTVIIQTFEFEPIPEHPSMERMELFDDGDGKTKMVVTSTFLSIEDRDGMMQSGMEEGMNQTYAALDRVLAEL